LSSLDDTVIHARSLAEHDAKIRSLFERLRKYILKLQLCNGHVTSDDGIRHDQRKVQSVETFSTPRSTKQLKSFLGIANYYGRFVP